MRRAVALVTVLAAAAAVPLAGNAAPTCTGSVPTAACGGRVVAEPLQTATFIQYGREAFPVLEAIEAVAPEVVEVFTLDELTKNAKHTSFDGQPIPIIRLTDESKPAAGKRKVVFSLSVHANETAGREGGIRYIEDVARWWAAEKTRPVFTGDVSFPLDQVLAQTEVWLGIVNVDGWSKGDLGSPGAVFDRGNGNGVDLNRQFPTVGWPNPNHTPRSEPESDGWVQFIKSLGPVTTASDIHGEITSPNNAFADLMWPADQWTPKEQAQELQLGLNVVKTIERKFADDGVVLGALTGATSSMTPAAASTGYDVVGYDDAGFMGDWFSQATGAIDIDAENFLSHTAPGNIWVGALEQAHVAAVRGIIESVTVESMITGAVKPKLDLGRVAYVNDPARVTAPAAPLEDGRSAKAVSASRMDYFADLAKDAGVPVTALRSGDIATADLSSYDSLVLADVAIPRDTAGRPVNAEAYVKALERFVTAGGQLVLTDGAIKVLADMGFSDEGALQEVATNAGHINFGTRDHPWEADVLPTAGQTYYEVPLGFTATSNAPHHGIASAAWEAAGGVTVGTVGADDDDTDDAETNDFTALGELPRGAGKISIFGAVLPTPTAENDPEDGLADYAMTIAGGQVFHQMLAYRRPGAAAAPAPAPAPAPQPAPAPKPAPRPAPLPATGADLPTAGTLALLTLAGAYAVRRRRTSAFSG
ncbi:MAG TPA: M14 family metallopeptidase [Mycobacteriales bacterium]|nr:M14 family metallopeptidase [Mycobacteriales bacterium]